MTYAAVAYASGAYAGPEAAAAAAAAAEPVVSVEVAFTSGPLDENPVWVAVPHRSGSTDCGRQAELGRFNAGHCTVVIPNADRTYDPKNTASPYAGLMRPMKRLRVLATYAGATYPLFTGWVDSWNQQRNPPNDAVAVVTATDGQKILGAADLPSSAYAREVLIDGPSVWWRLGEPDTQDTAYDFIGDLDLTYYGAPNRAESGLISREPGPSVFFEHTSTNRAEIQGKQGVTGFPFTLEFVLKLQAQRDDYLRHAYREAWTENLALDVLVGYTGSVPGGLSGKLLVGISGSGVGVGFASNGRVDDGQAHHIMIVAATVTDVTIYVDGVADSYTVAGTASPSIPSTPSRSIAIGNIGEEGQKDGLFGLDGWIQDVAIYNGQALSAARAAAHAGAVTTPWNNDTPGQRTARVLDAANWPANLRELDTGKSTLQSADLKGMTVLAHAQKVADSEFGELLITGAGTVRLVERTGLLNKPSEVTFSDNNIDLGYVSLSGDFDEVEIFNDVTVSRVEGVAQQAEDETSIGEYTRHSRSVDGLYHDSDDLSRSAAQFIVSEYREPLDRLTGMTLVRPETLEVAALVFPHMLGRQLLDVVTVEQTPQHVGTVDSRRVRIEGVRQSWAPKQWRTEWKLSPALTGNFLQLDNPATTIEGANAARLFF